MLVYQDKYFKPKDLAAIISVYVLVMVAYIMKIGQRCHESVQTQNSLRDKDLKKDEDDFSVIMEGG